MFNELSYKSGGLKLKDLDKKQKIVSFYFASFGSRDADNDVILEGAYKKTIEENKSRIKHLYNHNTTQAPGVIRELGVDTKGAYCVSQLADTTLGTDVYKEYVAGIITEHSQGFQTIQEEFNEIEGFNEIKEVKLWEVSSLTAWGSNANTPVIGMKSKKDISTAIKAMQNIEYAVRNSSISDDRCVELLKQYDKLKLAIEEFRLKSTNVTKDDNLQDTSFKEAIDKFSIN